MLNATPAYSTAAPLSADDGGTLELHASQSRLREILRDQSRREEKQQMHTQQHNPRQSQSRQPSSVRHQSFSSPSSSFPSPSSNLMAGHSSVQTYGVSPNKRLDLSSTPSATRMVPSSSGYFVYDRQGASIQSSGGSPLSNRDGSGSSTAPSSASHSVAPIHSDSIHPSSTSLLSDQSRREAAARQQVFGNEQQPLSNSSELIPGSADMSRTGSSATMTNGLDIKVVILGAQGVGKTSLVHRYTSGHFSASSVPSTIGASFLTKKLIVDGVKVRLQIWDTAGQERFRSMAPMYYRGSNAAVIVYDITNPSSFEDVKTWIDELRRNVSSDLVIHIVGSKLDLASHSRRVDLDEAREKIHSWISPPPPQQQEPDQLALPPSRSRSAFGALGRINTLSGIASTAAAPSSSGPTQSVSTNSRLPLYSSLSTLSTKPSKVIGGGGGGEAGNEDEGADGDAYSNPSTSSSSGNQQAVATPGLSARRPSSRNEEDWDEIEVSEVSSKDNEGIEDVFVGIATRLVEKKEEMEALARSRLNRNSVFLGQEESEGGDHAKSQTGLSWCCAT